MLFSIAKAMERRSIRGGSRLLRLLRQRGMLDRSVDFRLGDSLGIIVPLHRNGYDRTDLENWDPEFLAALSSAIHQVPGSVTFVDVGAYIGVISLKTLMNCPSISNLIAFEPNVDGFRWLKLNLDRLQIPAVAVCAAVADFEGLGRLAIPDASWTPGVESNHTQYFLEPAPDGPISVTTIDTLAQPISGNVAIKIDVEGGELSVLRGAMRTICNAPNAVVAFEAHPAVAARTGGDPVDCLRLLSSFRPFRFTVSETGQTLNTEKKFFEQVIPDRVYNIVSRSQ